MLLSCSYAVSTGCREGCSKLYARACSIARLDQAFHILILITEIDLKLYRRPDGSLFDVLIVGHETDDIAGSNRINDLQGNGISDVRAELALKTLGVGFGRSRVSDDQKVLVGQLCYMSQLRQRSRSSRGQ